MEAAECGAACLAMILAYYGRWVPLEELRSQCDVSRDGSNARNVVEAARVYGLEAKGWRREPAELRAMELPVIVFWNFNHFVVVEGFRGDIVYLNDPACGPRTVSWSEFDAAFTGVALSFSPGPQFRRHGRRPSLWPALRRRARGSEGALWFVGLAGLGLVLPGLAIPTFGRVFVDDYLVRGMTDWLRPLLLAMAAAAVVRASLLWLQQKTLVRLQAKLSVAGAGQFFWHLLRLPVEFYTQRYAGDVANRVALNRRVASLVAGQLTSSAVDLVLIVFYGALMLAIDRPLFFVAVLVVVVNAWVCQKARLARVDGSRRLGREEGKLMGVSMGGLQAIESLKATGSESDFFATWSGYQAKLSACQQELQSTAAALVQVPAVMQGMADALLLGLGGLRVVQGHMTLGMLVAFQGLMAAFLEPVKSCMKLLEKLQGAEADMGRLDDVLAHRLDPQACAPAAAAGPIKKLSGRVELRGVTFGYSRRKPALISKLDLVIAPGAVVALVGPSGCGKSTISRLVAGLYEPWEGEILLDGAPRRLVPRRSLASSVAMVDQDIVMFEGPFKDNLTLWDSSTPDVEIVRACVDACIHDDVTARPGAYDGMLEEGGRNLSGGQRQRLEIARALATNPSVLVLDEATSALDPVTERLIGENIRRRGCSCLIIAHRLSTIRDADEILVLDEGNVVQRGRHEELMRDAEGLYARLANA